MKAIQPRFYDKKYDIHTSKPLKKISVEILMLCMRKMKIVMIFLRDLHFNDKVGQELSHATRIYHFPLVM